MKQLSIRLFLVLGLFCALGLQGAHAAWNAAWTKRAKITLNTAETGLTITGPVDAVPLLVRLHTGNFQFLDAKPDGSDLRFIGADDKTPLKHHIEKFDSVNELAIVWVQVPKVLPGAKADFIWMYYGNANAPAANDAKGSYDATQGLVYHFAEGEALPQDSTANANHAAKSGAKPSTAGLIGAGAAFDGSGEIAVGVTPSLRASPGGFTVSMWVKPTDLSDMQLFGQQEGAAKLSLQITGGKLVAQAGTVATSPAGNLAAATWQHVALVVKDGLAVYLNGAEIAKVAGTVAPLGGEALIGRGFKGEIDEVEVASTARSADWIKLAAGTQGPDQKLIGVSPAEGGAEESGPSYLRILLGAVTVDGWVVIGILGVMFVLSVWVMISKIAFVARIARDNARFAGQFDKLFESINPDDTDAVHAAREREMAKAFPNSQLQSLFISGVHELRSRFVAYRKAGRELVLTPASLAAIRATVEAKLVRELQRLNGQMVVLTISIAGGPFLGLLGTVVGVMITFAAIAAAGDVNVNAIAPGIAAALVATVAGLAVAIPALFGYNYLTGRIGALTADMQVFVDELTTRFAETHSA
jgi:biopolymer transport protein ExbB